MLARIYRYLIPPHFDDEEKTRAAALIYGIVLALMGVTILNVVLVIFAHLSAISGLWFNVVFLIAGVGLLTLVRSGYQRAANLILCLVLWIFVTFVLFRNDGLMNPNYSAYALVIVVAALLLGGRGGLAFTGLVFITSLGLLYADLNWQIPHHNPATLITSFLVSGSVIFVILGVLLTFAVRGLGGALRRARHSESALAEQNQQLQTEVAERSRVEDALRLREEAGRKFQDRLKILNEVSIELGKTASFDDLCRAAVELGRERLGFDRLGLWFLNADQQTMTGSFGTDEAGNTRDERQTRTLNQGDTLFMRTIERKLRAGYEASGPLFDHFGKVVGQGWDAEAVLWDGDTVIGYIGADNLLNKLPLTDSDLETLTLYGAVLGGLCTRKRAEQGLRASEETALKFQQRLKMLAEVNIELAKAPTFDDLCRMAVELGRDRLGFDRLGIWFLIGTGPQMRGSFGVDEEGNIRDERQDISIADNDPLIRKATQKRLRLAYDDDVELVNHKMEVVGRGWNANATLWDGDNELGWISADNFLLKQPLTDSDLETLALYGTVLGNLFTRKRAEESLRASEENARQFQERLKVLNEVNIELAKAATFDDLCRAAIELGLKRLGFDRMGLWFWSPSGDEIVGAFGTDEQGNLRDERSISRQSNPGDLHIRTAGEQTLYVRSDEMPLRDENGNIVGHGWNVMVTLWDGKGAAGWLAVDNLLHQKPLTDTDVEILKLYSLALGNLCAQKRTEENLRASEESARQFQERLKVLNEVNIELANAESYNDLCLRGVELGREQLGFDRLGIWLWSPDDDRLVIAFGTDEKGTTERDLTPAFRPDYLQKLTDNERILNVLGEDVPLRNGDGSVVGRGWNVMATLWDGKDAIGLLAADNLLQQRPLTNSDIEILRLFSLALGNLSARRRTEDKLRSERNLLRTIIDTTPDLVYVKDLESRFLLTNRDSFAKESTFAFDADMVGKNDFDFAPEALASLYKADDEYIFRTGASILDKEEPGLDSRGKPIHLLTSKIPLRDPQGEITGLVGVSRDITQFKRVESALRASEEAARAFQERLKVLYQISLDLARVPTFDDLCRAGVELGRERLGFDRLGIWLLDSQPDYTVGSFGTDEHGQIRDERHVRLPLTDQYKAVLHGLLNESSYYFADDAPIFNDRSEAIAVGQKAMVILSDGHTVIGTISTDNLLHGKPITQQDLEILVLYGSTLGYLCARKRAEEALLKERNLLRTIIDILPDRIFVKDIQSRLLLVNKASWTHTPNVGGEEEMIGMTDTDLMPAELAEQIYADERELFTSGEPIQNREEPGRDYEGNPIYFLSTKVPLRDGQGNIIGLVGVSRDITNQKQAEQQRLELALQKERLELLTEFIGNMSHDLKTPLSVIKTTLYLMERLDDPARQEAKLQVIKEQTLRLEKLIQDVITMSRLENGAIPAFEPVDFNAIIQDVEAKLHPTAERKRLDIRLNLDPQLPHLPADENELWRLMANLYENALHYTPEGGTITLTTYFAEKMVIAEVQDTGIGIGQDDMPHIFDRFYRADPARSLERGGTGLGLAIVKRIVSLHGGEIVVQSDEGKGSLFRVLLPLTD